MTENSINIRADIRRKLRKEQRERMAMNKAPQERYIQATKSRIMQAFDNVTSGMFHDFIPRPKHYGEAAWQKWFITETKKMDKDTKDDIAILTALVTVLQVSYYCLWEPWRRPVTAIDDSFFMPEFIKLSYKYMKDEQARLEAENKYDANPQLLKSVYETHYGYYLAKKMVKSVDDIYLQCVTNGYPLCTHRNTAYRKMWIRYNNISVRGRRRVKMWDTFLQSDSPNSRRARPGNFYNLHPKSLQILDSLENDTAKLEYLFNEVPIDNVMADIIEAIHPHISNKEPCLGGWESKLIGIASKGYSELFFKAIRGFLGTWSVESPFWNINTTFYQTCTFITDKEKNKNVKVHWSPVESMYIQKNHSNLWNETNRTRTAFTRVLCHEKLKLGFFTKETIMTVFNIIRDKSKLRAGEILSKMHSLPFDMKGNIYDAIKANPYLAIEDIERNHFCFYLSNPTNQNGKSIPLDNRKSKLRFRTIVVNLLHRAQGIANDLWYEKFLEMDSDDVKRYNKSDWEAKTFTKERFKTYYINKWMWNREGLSEAEFLLRSDWTTEEEEDLLSLNLMLNPEFAMKQLLDWKMQSLATTMDKLNKEKEEYANELTYLSNYPEQGQLFSG